jgi:transposase
VIEMSQTKVARSGACSWGCGRVTKYHRFLLRLHLNQIDALDAAIATTDQQVQAGIVPFRFAIGAQVIVSEIGTDMSRFPSEGHLISWAGMCPRNTRAPAKRGSNRMRKGAPWLKTTLVQCPWAAVRKKDCYLKAQNSASQSVISLSNARMTSLGDCFLARVEDFWLTPWAQFAPQG